MHVKPGKGAAFVRTKIKNLLTGGVQEKTFRAGESVIPADVEKVDLQYTYQEGDELCFMNMNTFDEVRVSKTKVENWELLNEGNCLVQQLRRLYIVNIICFNRFNLSNNFLEWANC